MRRGLACHKRRIRHALAPALVLTALAGTLGVALAQDSGGSHPVDSALKMLNLKTELGKPPAFVEQSRRGGKDDFISVGAQHPNRTVKAKSASDIRAVEAELDAARARDERRAGIAPTAPATKPAKKIAKPAKAVSATQN